MITAIPRISADLFPRCMREHTIERMEEKRERAPALRPEDGPPADDARVKEWVEELCKRDARMWNAPPASCGGGRRGAEERESDPMAQATDKTIADMQTCGVTWTGEGAQHWLCKLLFALTKDGVVSDEAVRAIVERTYPGLDLSGAKLEPEEA